MAEEVAGTELAPRVLRLLRSNRRQDRYADELTQRDSIGAPQMACTSLSQSLLDLNCTANERNKINRRKLNYGNITVPTQCSHPKCGREFLRGCERHGKARNACDAFGRSLRLATAAKTTAPCAYCGGCLWCRCTAGSRTCTPHRHIPNTISAMPDPWLKTIDLMYHNTIQCILGKEVSLYD